MAPVSTSHQNEKLKFHDVCGSLVSLSNLNRTATRNHPHQEFNNGLIMSSEPLKDNQLFEVRIDRKIYAWSGSIEIGVTTLDPSTTPLPSSATNLRDGSWVMSGTSVLNDGRSILEEYGTDLDQLGEGDRVGVMRSSNGDLHFFVNGINQGVAASNVLSNIYAVVDMYGKCAQVTLMDSTEARILANDISNENLAASFLHSSHSSHHSRHDKLKFHERCGLLIDLSNNNQTAERKRPSDEFNNGVCMTNRPLKDDELFEIRIDELVNKWSGSIELGVTTHNPDTLEFPATMTNMRNNGACTIMMSGSGILTNGKGTRREYGEFNLDELHEGDRIGVVRKSNGNLHYFINGLDQGMASNGVPSVIYGVVDLYGMTVKVTIVDHSELSSPETLDHTSNDNMIDSLNSAIEECSINENDKLVFHPSHHGKNVAVINNGRTGHRPKALDDFNNAVLLTNRPLLPNETFEVVIERLVVKWAGSIEIGVTTHSPFDLEFPSTMTNMRTGTTWMMTGNGVMYNGTTIVDEYGLSLDRLNVGDRVGVTRLQNGNLKFFVNGVDQGVADTNVPEKVFGVIDLYGQAAQASIVDRYSGCVDQNNSPTSVPPSSSLTLGNDLRFHSIRGKNARIIHHGVTATRPNAQGEFNDAILISNRPLKDNEMFEIIIEQMVDRWSGSIEAGVTTIPPDKLELPSTMTDMNHDTWMLSGSAVMRDGATVRNGYKCDLDQLRVGTRIGMMRHSDGTLHYYVNGEDQGAACSYIPTGVYAVIDLYGQCAQVSIVQPSVYPVSSSDSSALSPESLYVNVPLPVSNEVGHHFHSCCGKNIMLRNNATTACRVRGSNNSLVFSATPLENEEIFEIQVEHLYTNWAGALLFGLTSYIPNSGGSQHVPISAQDLYCANEVWLVTGTQVLKNGQLVRDNYGPSLNRLSIGDRIGVKRSNAGNMHIFINGEDIGIVASNIATKPYVVLDIQGRTATVSICSMVAVAQSPLPEVPTFEEASCKETIPYEFHDNRGSNIEFLSGISARRTSGFNQGIILANKPLIRNHLFQIRIDKLDSRWNSSLQVGIISQIPEKLTLPLSAISLRKSAWVITGDSVFHDGVKVKSRYGPNLDSLQVGHLVGILVDAENQLRLVVNGVDQGVAAKGIPDTPYAFVDVYGQCERVTLVESDCQALLPEIDHREKADKETNVREKIGKPLLFDQNLVRNCEYLNACKRFKTLLGFPDGYFQKDVIVCYCETCHKIRGDEPYYRKGDPPKDYALPFGWCRFALRLTSKAENSCVQEKWHVAFHGTKIGAVRRILDNGELLPIGQMGLGPFSKDIGKLLRDKDVESCQVCISPTLKYAGSSVFSSRQSFTDPKTKKQLQARVAFQVYVRPNSYSPRSVSGEQFDKHFSNSDLEWHAKERGATVLQSLLVKIEEL